MNLSLLIKTLNTETEQIIEQALTQALQLKQTHAGLAHVLYQLIPISQEIIRKELLSYIHQQVTGEVDVPTLSQSVVDLISAAWLLASLQYQQKTINPNLLLLAALTDSSLRQQAEKMSPHLAHYDLADLQRHMAINPIELSTNKKIGHLEQYTTDITKLAASGKIDPMVGREQELRQLIDILLRRRQNNPILVGEPGVGKTALVEGLALRIIQKDVPAFLQNTQILQLELANLTAGASIKGELERRLTAVIDAVKQGGKNYLLFIDEAHTLISGQGEHSVAANILKPLLARGQLRTIAATTWREYKQHIEKDPALVRRFQVIKIHEPDIATANTMLSTQVPLLERHHNISITEDAVRAACELSARFLPERLLPDKAMSCLDTACAHLVSCKQIDSLQKSSQRQGKPERTDYTVKPRDIATVLSAWTGIPVANILANKQDNLLHLREKLAQRVIGQDQALSQIAHTVQLGSCGLQDENKPIGVFLLAGPSGVGKTETALALAQSIYGSENQLLTINMSEFKQSHRTASLTGSPPGYVGYGEGGVLTEAVRRQPYQLILLDEMEKAHPSVQDLFYRVLDKGILQDAEGREVDFRHTIIVMTCNAAEDLIRAQTEDFDWWNADFQIAFEQALTCYFKPAFLGRVQILPYRELSSAHLSALIQTKIQHLTKKVKQRFDRVLHCDPCVLDYLLQQCRSATSGARQLNHLFNRELLPELSQQLLVKPNTYAIKLTMRDSKSINCLLLKT